MAVEVFNNRGESEIYDRPIFSRRYNDDGPTSSKDDSIMKEEIKGPLVEAKKEFFEELQDDSLSLDTCVRLNNRS